MSEQANMAARYECEIPEGYEARIEGNKVILERKESEDEKIRKQLIGFLSGRYALCNINTKDAIAYLEKQKDERELGFIEGKVEGVWSEMHLKNAILAAEKEWGANSCTATWLKHLRDNYKKCNSRWKPSEEQMEVLLNTEGLVRANNYPENAKIIASLYNDLKKL